MTSKQQSPPPADSRADGTGGGGVGLPRRQPGTADLSVFTSRPGGPSSRDRARRRPSAPREWGWFVPLIVLLLALAGCSGAATRTAVPVGNGNGPLAKVCPATVVVQTSWYLESTRGGEVQLLMGGKYTPDPAHKLVRGPLMDQGQDTGVQLELRAGGPAVSDQPVSALMATDRSILLGEQATDEQVLGWMSGQPTVAVFAPFQVDPVVLIWDADRHPDWNSASDIGQTNETVFTFDNPTTDFLIGAGVLRPKQVNTSWKGSPSEFMTHPDAAVGGFSTNEPFIYQSLGRKVASAYLTSSDWPNYRNTLTVRRADLGRWGPCLDRLVPILQRATVEFMNHPDPALQAMVALDKAWGSPYPYSIEQARYGVQVTRKDGLVVNGPGGWVGGFKTERFKAMITALGPIYAATKFGHKTIPPDLTADTLGDPSFLDPTIRLP